MGPFPTTASGTLFLWVVEQHLVGYKTLVVVQLFLEMQLTMAIAIGGTAKISSFSTASGTFSTSMGTLYTIASDYASFVIGQYNDSGSTVTSSATSFSTK